MTSWVSLAAFRGLDNNTFFIGSDSKVANSDLDVRSYVYKTAKLTFSLNIKLRAQGLGFCEFINCHGTQIIFVKYAKRKIFCSVFFRARC